MGLECLKPKAKPRGVEVDASAGSMNAKWLGLKLQVK
jgi:hypothetical protein